MSVTWALVLFRQLLGDMAAVEVLVGGSLVEGEEGMAAIVTSTPRRCLLGEGEEGDGGNSDFDATAVTWALVLFRQLLGDMAAAEVLVGGSLIKGGKGDGSNSDFDATALPVGVLAGRSLSKVGSNGGGNDFDAVALLGLQLCFDLVASVD